MSNENEISPLVTELRCLETHLETPVVPGELIDWLTEVDRILSTLVPSLRSQVQGRHRDLITEIAEQDQGLFARVEQLTNEDRKILEDAERQSHVISQMVRHSDQMEPDEGRVRRAVEKVVDEGLQLVIRIRKQEAAIGTWLMEAFDRDRGVAD